MTSSYKQFIKNLNENMIYEQISADKICIRNNTTIQCVCSNYEYDFIDINYEYISFKNSFILIIDFPNIGGGTSFFLKTILARYKGNFTFLIVRSYNGLLKFENDN